MAGDRHAPRDDDAALVREVAAGSQDALAALYDRYVDAVYAAAIRLTSDRQVAEEVVQETFLALWNRAELFDPNTGSLAAWLHTIARNRTVDRLRAAGRRPSLVPLSAAAGNDEHDTAALERIAASGTVLGGADLGPGPEGELAAAELRDVIRGAAGLAAGNGEDADAKGIDATAGSAE
jgi:RNA polymerase sigma factor (sigma-70 family)